uniref:Uncharacterized protein n=2 Tax=Vitis vinifera TaxID=29760 RepID=A5C6F6_VITVI|nr:hypothetical protein VITISV_026013 [Vitis vinifera]
MAKTRGAHVASPSTRNPRTRASLAQDSTYEAPQAPVIPPFEGGVPSNPPQHRHETRRPPTTLGASTSRPKRSVCHPPTKKAKFLGPRESSTPPLLQSPATEARPFHSEICFDMKTFRQQPELRDSFRLLQRYHLEHLMTHRDFFYPIVALDFYQSMTTRCVRNPNVIHFIIDGRHGILGARHIVEALHIAYEPAQQAEIPIEIIPLAPTTPSIVPMPEAISSASPTILEAPLIVPATSTPPPSESSITISTLEFRGPCHTLQTLSTTQGALFQQMTVIRAHQDQFIAMQTQHTTILSQIQQHLGILPPPEHEMPGPSEPTAPSEEATPAEQAIPSEKATPVKHTMPHQETTTAEVETPIQSTQETTTEPSSPHDPPTTT